MKVKTGSYCLCLKMYQMNEELKATDKVNAIQSTNVRKTVKNNLTILRYLSDVGGKKQIFPIV